MRSHALNHRLARIAARCAALLAALALAACASAAPTASPITEPPPSDTPVSGPTSTPVPPTETAAPTETPVLSPTAVPTSRIPSATPAITPGPQSTPVPTTDPSLLLDLCTVITIEEVEAATGEDVSEASSAPASCLYAFAGSDPSMQRAISLAAAQGDEAKEAMLNTVMLLGLITGSQEAADIVDQLRTAGAAMSVADFAEATGDVLTALGFAGAPITGVGDQATWSQYPDLPVSILIAVQGDTLVMLNQVGMGEAAAQNASAALARLLLERLPPTFEVLP